MLYFNLDHYVTANTDGRRSRRWEQNYINQMKLHYIEDESM